MSEEEDRLYKYLHKTIPSFDKLRNWRPNDLKNYKTGNNLEMDIYIPKLKIGFEYQGMVHFKHIKKFHNNPDESRENDTIKDQLAINSRRKISIVEIFPSDLTGDMKKNILLRISNTISYYRNKRRMKQAIRLEFLSLIIDNDIKEQCVISRGKGVLRRKDGSFFDLNYDKLRVLIKEHRLCKSHWRKNEKRRKRIASCGQSVINYSKM